VLEIPAHGAGFRQPFTGPVFVWLLRLAVLQTLTIMEILSPADRLYATPAKPVIEAPTLKIQALRDAEGPASKLYDAADQFGNAPRELALAMNPTGTSEALAHQAANFAHSARDLGLTQAQIQKLAAVGRTAMASPVSEEQDRTNQLQGIKALREQYGDTFDEAFADARKAAQRDPRIAGFLNRGGIGNRPEVLALFAELGAQQRRAGRLK